MSVNSSKSDSSNTSACDYRDTQCTETCLQICHTSKWLARRPLYKVTSKGSCLQGAVWFCWAAGLSILKQLRMRCLVRGAQTTSDNSRQPIKRGLSGMSIHPKENLLKVLSLEVLDISDNPHFMSCLELSQVVVEPCPGNPSQKPAFLGPTVPNPASDMLWYRA